jgi:hypothetical protein
MAWIGMLVLLVVAMIALEGLGAERSFRRSLDPLEPREWEQRVLDELLLGRSR